MNKWDILFFGSMLAVGGFVMFWPWMGGTDMWRPQPLKLWWAKWRYYKSIGWDTSEVFSGAREKQRDRLRVLRRRMGDVEYKKFILMRYPGFRSPDWGFDV